MASPDHDSITFYVNQQKDDAHTTREDLVAANLAVSAFTYEERVVETITLGKIFDAHGVPYYLKCDIEGVDEEVLNQLVLDPRRPKFISCELSDIGIMARMFSAGYRLFQIVNQYWNPAIDVTEPAREGRFAPVQFTGHMTGLFGLELPQHKWLTLDEAVHLYQTWIELRRIDPEFAPGWCDCHATHLSREELAGSNAFA